MQRWAQLLKIYLGARSCCNLLVHNCNHNAKCNIFCSHPVNWGGGSLSSRIIRTICIWGPNTCVSTRSTTTLKISINEIGVKIEYWVFGLQIKNYLLGAPIGRDMYYTQQAPFQINDPVFHSILFKWPISTSWDSHFIALDHFHPYYGSLWILLFRRFWNTYHIKQKILLVHCDNIIYIN